MIKRTDNFVAKVGDYICRHKLLELQGHYLVGLSGGADSVALLLVLQRLGYRVEAVHCNFHLRGDESKRDEEFCASFCDRLQVPFHRVHFDTQAYAELHHESIETAARNLRYRYFNRLCDDIGADAVCVAHHRDDQVETVLMHLVRGSGLDGLIGMQPRNGKIIRPLLGVTREEIENFLASLCDAVTGKRGQHYVIDSTNLLTDAALRNRFRLEVLPLLRTLNPGVDKVVANMAERLSGVKKIYDVAIKHETENAKCSDGYDIETICHSEAPECLLYEILQRYNFSSQQVHLVFPQLNGVSGRHWESSSHVATVNRGKLIVYPKNDLIQTSMPSIVVKEPGRYVFGETQFFVFLEEERDLQDQPGRNRWEAMLDSTKVQWPLTVRHVRKGDRFVPFGMTGSKLVSDYMTDRKKSLPDKQRQLVVEDAKGRIIWLVDERTDNRFRVEKETTSILKIIYGANETC